MPQTLRDSTIRTQPNSLRPDLDHIRGKQATVRIDPNPEDRKREILAIIQRTKAELGLSQKAMAQSAKCVESELSDALNARENRRFDVSWLWQQDDVFLLRFIQIVQEERGLTPQCARDVQRRRIVELIDLLLREVA